MTHLNDTPITLTPELLAHYDSRARTLRSQSFWSLFRSQPQKTEAVANIPLRQPCNDSTLTTSSPLAA